RAGDPAERLTSLQQVRHGGAALAEKLGRGRRRLRRIRLLEEIPAHRREQLGVGRGRLAKGKRHSLTSSWVLVSCRTLPGALEAILQKDAERCTRGDIVGTAVDAAKRDRVVHRAAENQSLGHLASQAEAWRETPIVASLRCRAPERKDRHALGDPKLEKAPRLGFLIEKILSGDRRTEKNEIFPLARRPAEDVEGV